MAAISGRVQHPIRASSPSVRCLQWSLAFLCLLVMLAAEVHAVEWRFRPRVSVAETYSDNINLAPDGGERHDFVTDVSPGFSLRGEGRRVFLDLFYNLQYLNYARDTRNDRFNHQLRAVGNAELLEDLFFVDLRSSYRQENTDSLGRLASDTLSVTGNENDVFTFLVSPYLRRRFGTFMDAELRYTHDRVERIDLDDDSTGNSGRFELTSGSEFQSLPWLMYYQYTNEDSDRSGTSIFERGEARGTYFLTRKIGIQFGGGYERIKFDFPPRDDDEITWRAGLTLRPTPRTVLEGGIEHRIFGDAPFVSLSHRSRRTAVTLSYSENITTTNRIRLDRVFLPVVDVFGDPILDPDTGEAVRIPVDLPTQVNEVVVNKSLNGNLAVQGIRTVAGLAVFGARREYEISPDEQVYGLRLYADRSLNPVMSAGAWGEWSRREFDSAAPDRDRWEVGLRLRREFTPDFSGNIAARHITQTSDSPADEFDENRISLQLNKAF